MFGESEGIAADPGLVVVQAAAGEVGVGSFVEKDLDDFRLVLDDGPQQRRKFAAAVLVRILPEENLEPMLKYFISSSLMQNKTMYVEPGSYFQASPIVAMPTSRFVHLSFCPHVVL
jgi:hypothetical protein